MAASILFTGNTFAGVNRLASCLNLQFINESVFYDTKHRFLFPVLNQAWENEQRIVRQDLANPSAINLNVMDVVTALGTMPSMVHTR